MKLPPGSKYFGLAGLVGLAAVLLMHSYISGKVAQPSRPTAQVVVAEVDIAPGTALADKLLRVATWPKEIIPAKAIGNLKDLEGRVTQMGIAKGEAILLTKLASEGTSAGLGGMLAPNKLAVTVKTDEVSGVAGFVNPGDRIDVLVEMQEGEEHFSKLILQNLKVLSKGQIWDQTTDKNNPQVVPTVTLEVAPEQAESLNLASFQGRVRLALRNQLNHTQFSTNGVVVSQLSSKRPAPPAVKHAEKPEPKQQKVITVMKGMNVTDQAL